MNRSRLRCETHAVGRGTAWEQLGVFSLYFGVHPGKVWSKYQCGFTIVHDESTWDAGVNLENARGTRRCDFTIVHCESMRGGVNRESMCELLDEHTLNFSGQCGGRYGTE